MPLSSQGEAKRFLVDLISREAQRQGEALSDVDVRVLLFSVDEPQSGEGIPEERLLDNDSDFEERMRFLFGSAYKKAGSDEKTKIMQAIREVNEGDHYVAVIAQEP
jgi:hypothetical protein